MMNGRIFEGKYLFFPKPCALKEVECTRCGKKNMARCIVGGGDNRKVCFCLEDDCLRKDSDASKAIARRKYCRRLKVKQDECEKQKAGIEELKKDAKGHLKPSHSKNLTEGLWWHQD